MSFYDPDFMWSLGRHLLIYRRGDFVIVQDGKQIKVKHDFGRDDICYFSNISVEGVFNFYGQYQPRYNQVSPKIEIIEVVRISNDLNLLGDHTMGDAEHYLMLLRMMV